jgi:hypothetical protein
MKLNDVYHLIIYYCLNCIRRDQNACIKQALEALVVFPYIDACIMVQFILRSKNWKRKGGDQYRKMMQLMPI